MALKAVNEPSRSDEYVDRNWKYKMVESVVCRSMNNEKQAQLVDDDEVGGDVETLESLAIGR